METYVVRSGDTLWNIARRCGVTAEELAVVNQLPFLSLLSPFSWRASASGT